MSWWLHAGDVTTGVALLYSAFIRLGQFTAFPVMGEDVEPPTIQFREAGSPLRHDLRGSRSVGSAISPHHNQRRGRTR